MADRDVNIKVKVDDSGATATLNGVETKLDGLGPVAEKASAQATKGFSNFQASIVSLQSGLQLAETAIHAIGGTISTVFDGISRGSSVDDVEVGFKRLTESAGGVSDVLINKLQLASDGTVSKLDLMKGAIGGLRANMKPDEIELVTKASRALAEETGGSFKDTFDGLIDSLQKGNDRFLKSQGILIDNEKAYEDFAKTIGTTGDKLSEQGKAAAITQASLVALGAKVASVGEISRDSGDRIDIFKAALTDATDQAWKHVAADDGVNKALDDLTATIKDVDFAPIIQGLTTLIALALKAVGPITSVGNAIGDAFKWVAEKSIAPKINEFNSALDQVVENLSKNTPEATKKATEEFNKITAAFDKQDIVLKGAVIDNLNKVGLQLQDVATKSTNLATKSDAVTSAVAKTAAATKRDTDVLIDHTKAQEEAKAKADKFAEAMAGVAAKIALVVGTTGNSGLDVLSNKIREAMDPSTANDMNLKLEQIAASVVKATGNTKDFDAALALVMNGFKGAKEQADELTKATDEAAQAAKDLGKEVGSIFAGAIGEFASGGNGLGSLFSGLGGMLGEGLSKPLEGTLGTILGSDVGSMLGPVAGELGSLAGEQISKGLSSAFHHVFGGRDAQGQLRDTVQDYLSKAIDSSNLQVFIDGQLKGLNFDFLGGTDAFSTGNFDNYFQTLTSDAQGAFGAVAAGIADLAGVSQEIAPQIAAVLSQDVGGSLLNLQLVAQSLGLDMSKLGDIVVSSFKKGGLSFAEAEQQLIGIQKLTEKGIPDALGATTQAFQNFGAAGVKGGQASIKSLQDLGTEAKELHLKTLPELEQALIADTNNNKEAVKKLFDALHIYGVDSLDQIETISDKTAIAVGANLEAANFPFAETAQKLDDLKKQIDSIPTTVEKNIVYNVKVNADSTGIAALKTSDSGSSLVRSASPNSNQGIGAGR
jgi:hypothetical protein